MNQSCMRTLLLLALEILAASNLFARQANIGYKLGYSRCFSLQDKETDKKQLQYTGANTEVFYRYTTKSNLAFEAGLQYAHVKQPGPFDYYAFEPYHRKNNVSLLVSAQYQLEKWSNGKQAFRTYFGIALGAQGTRLALIYPPGCFGTKETDVFYSASFLAGVNQVFVFECNRSLSLQSTVSVMADITAANNLPGQLCAQLALSYRLAP